MILHIQNLIKMADLFEPYLTVPAVPPSDNRRSIKGKGWAEVSEFKKHVEATLLSKKITLPSPPVVVYYRVFFKTNHYREPKNCSKALIDALYPKRRGGDDDVGAWDYPFRLVDKVNPRTEIWVVEIDSLDETSKEALHRQIDWINGQRTGNA